MAVELNNHIKMLGTREHAKASEVYVDVVFTYDDKQEYLSIPIVYRRAGIKLENDDEVINHLNSVYEEIKPEKRAKWIADQKAFWDEKPNAGVTKSFFDALCDFKWKCVSHQLPQNPNWARRIQDLKEFGYTIATNTNKNCDVCGSAKTHLLLIPIKRVDGGGNGYETWSPALRKRIIKVLGEIDSYEDAKNPHCLPDHKFSEIRWDENTKEKNLDSMTDEEIKAKFQLLTNQRNQQKREVCRHCFQTGERGIIFGIPYFYEGDEKWDDSIPKTGKLAEKGCVGCPWYDIERWRQELIKKLKESNNSEDDKD